MSAPPAEPEAPEELPRHARLSRELEDFLERLDGKDTTVGELVELIGDRGFGLLLLILSLPAALPLPAPGYATPFGLVMILLAFQMIGGRHTPWVPARLARVRVPFSLLRFSVRNGRLPLRAVELLVRPRLQTLSRNRVFLSLVGVTILLMACSMSLPIPLTNTAPSFVIFMLAAGILEEDGLLLLGGILLAPVAAGIAGLAIYTAVTMGPEAVEETVKPLLKGWLGMGEG